MMIPALVLVSAESGFSSSRSCKGLNFICFLCLRTGAAYRKRPRRVSTREPSLELRGRCGIQRHAKAGDVTVILAAAHVAVAVKPGDGGAVRSEERRVGKECSAGRAPAP